MAKPKEIDIEYMRYLFTLDAERGLLIRRVWRAHNAQIGDVVGALNSKGYHHVSVNKQFWPVHRIIFALHYGWAPEYVDHENHNKLDNRPENLRPATVQQNTGNTGVSRHNTSGIKGVSWNTLRQEWRAQIKINGKQTCIGRFDSKEDAALAYAEAAKNHFGEYANPARVPNAVAK